MSTAKENGETAKARRHTIVVVAENRDGVLARITALFAARGYEIDGIAVGPALDPAAVRIVIVVRGDERTVEQVTKQLQKLIEVIKVTDLTDVDHVAREMVLVRVAAREDVVAIVDRFDARIVGRASDTYVVEMTGDESSVTSFLERLRPFGIHELVRTGKIAISRGESERGAAPTSGATRRRHPRYPVSFDVRVASLDAHSRVRAHDLSTGGMSLTTTSPVTLGSTIALQIVHPVTGEQFRLSAIVRRHIARPDFRGIAVEFVDVDEGNRRRLHDFMSGETSGSPELE